MNPNNPVQAAQAAIQGLTPGQAPALPQVNVGMPTGYNANGTMAPVGTAAPTTHSSTYNEANALNQFLQAGTPGQLKLGANAANNAQQVSNDYYAAQAARQKQIADAQQQQANLDPKNFIQSQSEDGGYNFTDPTGKPITAWQYAKVQGKDVTDVLKGSSNPVDKQYIMDHDNMQKISDVLQTSAGKSQNDINKSLDKVAQAAGFTGGKQLTESLSNAGLKTPMDMMKAFMQAYPNIWGSINNSQPGGTSVGNFRGTGAQDQANYWGK